MPYAGLENPQSLNLYAYALNNPVTRVDFDGHFVGPGQGTDGTDVTLDWARMMGGYGPLLPLPQLPHRQGAVIGGEWSRCICAKGPRGGKGGQGKGERSRAARPDGTPDPGKHVKASKEHPGQWEVKDPHTGNWKLKPKGWSPDVARKVGTGAALTAGAVAVGQAILESAPVWGPVLAL